MSRTKAETTYEETVKKAYSEAKELGLTGRERLNFVRPLIKKSQDEMNEEFENNEQIFSENSDITCNGLSNTHLFG